MYALHWLGFRVEIRFFLQGIWAPDGALFLLCIVLFDQRVIAISQTLSAVLVKSNESAFLGL